MTNVQPHFGDEAVRLLFHRYREGGALVMVHGGLVLIIICELPHEPCIIIFFVSK